MDPALARSDGFTTGKHLAQEAAKRPWAMAAQAEPAVGRRKHKQQLAALGEGRTEVLQAYLAEQLGRLSGSAAEVFEASILGTEPAAQQPQRQQRGSPPRRKKRHSPPPSGYRLGQAPDPILYPHGSKSTHLGPQTKGGAAAAPDRGRPDVIVPRDDRARGSPTAPDFPQVIDRWPSHSSAQHPDDLGALWAPFSPPPLVVDDGVLFEDRSVQAHSPARARSRTAAARDAMDPSRSGGSSPAKSAMSEQLLRTAPKLLQDLEYYLNRELEENAVGGPERVGDPVRLRIIGECFDAYIGQCTTYRPLLAKIKSEYEETVALLRSQVESIAPSMNRLATLQHTTAAEKVDQRVAHFRDTATLREQNEANKAVVGRLEAKIQELQVDLKAKNKLIDKMKEDAANDFSQNQALSAAVQHHKSLAASSEGLWLEKEGLANELDKAQKQIDKYSIAMEGAVTGEIHQGLQTMYEQLEERHKTVQSERDSATRKIEAKEAMEARQAQKVEKMAEQIASLKGDVTPRPRKEPVVSVLGASASAEAALSEASTAKVVDLLVEKVTELAARVAALKKTAPNDDPYFLGLGTGPEVPPALRLAEGKRIRNRRMVKRDVEFLVHSLFKRKAIDDREKKEKDLEPLNFDEFFAAELKSKYIHDGRVAEIAYNLLDACKRYSYDADIELFRKVMDGDISEKVLRSQLRMLHEIKQGIQATAVDEAGTAVKGAPTKEQVLEVVKNHPMMKFQRESAYDTLKEKLDLDAPKKGPVDCNKLFEEDSEGNQTGFVEALRDLNLADREEYFDQLEEAICSQEPAGDNDGRVNVLQLRAAVAQIDPNKSPEDVDALLRLGLMMEKTVEVEKEELDEDGNVVGTTMERKVVERKLMHPQADLPHEAALFGINEFMSLVRKNAVTRHSPAPQVSAPKVSVLADGEGGGGEA